MEGSKRNFKFVTVQQPGLPAEPKDVFALRSHVRQSIALEKRSRLQRKPQRSRLVPKPFSSARLDDKRTAEETTTLTTREEQLSWNQNQILKGPLVIHPFASITADYVRLPIQRLDHLFKSPTFSQVVEPGFSASHVDSRRSLQVGLPGCFSDPAFLHALVHSMIQASNKGQQTMEQLRIHVDAIAALNKALAQQENGLPLSTLGAIMALRGAAYKRGDCRAHEQHVRGLARALESVRRPLTLPIRMVLVWQDIYASVLIRSPRQLDLTYLSSCINWARAYTTSNRVLPPGFERHKDVIPAAVTGLCQDLIQLDKVVVVRKPIQDGDVNQHAALFQETSSITNPALDYGSMEAIANSVRLATFILTYVTHINIGSSTEVPIKLAEQLINILESDLSATAEIDVANEESIWAGRWDLQLWLLFIGLNTIHLFEKTTDSLKERYAEALQAFRLRLVSYISHSPSPEYMLNSPRELLDAALNDYIYVKGWLECRSDLEDWEPLDLLAGTKSELAKD